MINRVRKNCGLSFYFVLEMEKKGIVGEAAKKDTRLLALMMVYREKNAV